MSYSTNDGDNNDEKHAVGKIDHETLFPFSNVKVSRYIVKWNDSIVIATTIHDRKFPKCIQMHVDILEAQDAGDHNC